MTRVLVVGGSGFVGSAVVAALGRRGIPTLVHRAPRLDAVPASAAADAAATAAAELTADPEDSLVRALRWADVLVIAAGQADAGAGDETVLMAANAAMPYAVALLARAHDVRRVIHVSSAAVQGNQQVLDASARTVPFSPYSRSKAAGERLLLGLGWDGVTVYRPQGVHGPGRRTTQVLTTFARSRFSSVAGRQERATPQALVADVGDAVACLATMEEQPPAIVVHPWSGVTTACLLEELGGHPPMRLPTALCRGVVWALTLVGSRRPSLAAGARRLELLWFGQSVQESWLDQGRWQPGDQDWELLGRLAQEARRPSGKKALLRTRETTGETRD